MKKLIFISLMLLLTAQQLFSQLQAEFQYTLIVEDARGKKDSVVIGYDRRAQYVKLDTAFGEIDIRNRPFDSVLDVRVAEARNRFSITFHSKKAIATFEGDCAQIAASNVVTLLIRAKYYPIKFSWNKDLFGDPCRSQSLLLPSDQYFSRDPNVPNTGQGSLDSTYFITRQFYQSQKIEKFDKRAPSGEPNPTYYYAFKALTNAGTQDTIWTYSNVFRSELLNPVKESIVKSLTSFPNPCIDDLTIELPDYETGQIEILDVFGRKIQSIKVQSINQLKIDVRDLNHGLYFLKLRTDKNKIYLSKFVKS